MCSLAHFDKVLTLQLYKYATITEKIKNVLLNELPKRHYGMQPFTMFKIILDFLNVFANYVRSQFSLLTKCVTCF